MSRKDVLRWLVGLAIMLDSGLVGRLAMRPVAGRLARLIRKTRTELDEALLGAVSPHVPIWFPALGGALGMRYAQADAEIQARGDHLALSGVLFSVTLAIAAFLTRMIASRAN